MKRTFRSLETARKAIKPPKPMAVAEERRIAPLLPYVAQGAIPFDAETKQLTRRFLDKVYRDLAAGREGGW